MRVEIDTYGDDIDGNRGIGVRCYELEEDDRETVIEQIGEFMMYHRYIPNTLPIHMICPITEQDVEIETYVKEWLND